MRKTSAMVVLVLLWGAGCGVPSRLPAAEPLGDSELDSITGASTAAGYRCGTGGAGLCAPRTDVPVTYFVCTLVDNNTGQPRPEVDQSSIYVPPPSVLPVDGNGDLKRGVLPTPTGCHWHCEQRDGSATPDYSNNPPVKGCVKQDDSTGTCSYGPEWTPCGVLRLLDAQGRQIGTIQLWHQECRNN